MPSKMLSPSDILQRRIEEALTDLVSLPIWGTCRALNMQMFDLGKCRTTVNAKGKRVEVSEYSLHIQCPWRIVGPEGIIVGSEDRNYPEDEESDWSEFDPDGPTRSEARISGWLEQHEESPLVVDSVEANHVGGFKLFLSKGFVLEVFPAHSLRGETCDYWRLIRPSEGASHFVVTGHGIEDDV